MKGGKDGRRKGGKEERREGRRRKRVVKGEKEEKGRYREEAESGLEASPRLASRKELQSLLPRARTSFFNSLSEESRVVDLILEIWVPSCL